ncbi:hypothetical protein Pan97_04840 [Bremerella volcania]|uniref:Uncharacterized protein n=1 Tax=Bremerella volcania TaxID=2527984 RepID=A0A518C2Q6_9BACT|nr:hypothetical protein [Bremerella volcania]QDU73511.1 hypothetical protein Pan97_04840 [Bremerella volcania]
MMPRLPVAARLLTLLVLTTFICCAAVARADETAARSADHQKFTEDFWTFLQDKYSDWKQLEGFPQNVPAPEAGTDGTIYVNDAAAKDLAKLDYGSIVVVEYQRDGKPYALSALFRARPGVNKKNDDWYELYYLADGTIVKSSADSSKYNRPGFLTKVIDGRLWVLSLDSPSISDLVAGEGPEKHVTLPGAGPDRKTIKTDSRETAIHYLFAKPGFVTYFEDGRAWIFAKNTEAATHFKKEGLPEKHVTRIGAGPMRTTIKAPDAETIDMFLGKPEK